MQDAKSRNTRSAKGTDPFRRNSGGGLETAKRKLPFPARLACFWPLAVVPGLTLSLVLGQAVPGVVLAYVCNSLFTVLFYREDKRLAERQNWRIPEYYLHLWELLCGWPGALYAQARFRHKWKKVSYMAVFWLYVILNVAGVCYLVCPGTAKAAAADILNMIRDILNGR